MQVAEVFVNIPVKSIAKAFSYIVPDELTVGVGWRVFVPFGGRKVEGFILSMREESQAQAGKSYQLKEIISAVDEEAWFTPKMIKAARWLSDFYLCSLAEIMRLFMPGKSGLKITVSYAAEESMGEHLMLSMPLARRIYQYLLAEGPRSLRELRKALPEAGEDLPALVERMVSYQVLRKDYLAEKRDKARYEKYVLLKVEFTEALKNDFKRKKAQLHLLELLASNEGKELSSANLKEAGVSPATIRAVAEQGLVEVRQRRVLRDSYGADNEGRNSAREIQLTEAQEDALAALGQAAAARTFQGFLLKGVTGSGKTQVYMELARKVRALGRQVIVLVPEIALTGQVVASFKEYFPEDIMVMHSRLSLTERNDAILRVRRGEAGIIIGARSALFTPAAEIGLIVMDEEQDMSYKQDESPRYHARVVAEQLARIHGAVLLLGSATPSLETYYRANNGELKLLELPERIGSLPMPLVHAVDMRRELKMGNRHIISRDLQRLLEETLARGEQSIIMLNRRGFSTFVMCRSCGEVIKCKLCGLPLVYHKNGRLSCHHCDVTEPVPDVCPKCGSPYIKYFGSGTEKLEQELRTIMPQARVIRMDRDTTGTKFAHRDILSRFRRHEYDILLGTQMVAKGHDIPNVTSVGIISADSSLNMPDFRAAERCFMLITQTAGRAGRHGGRGRVIVQTYNPQHYAVTAGLKQDYEEFFRQELELRKELFYPPYSRIVKLLFQDEDEEVAKGNGRRLVRAFEESFRGSKSHMIIGPSPAVIAKFRNIYRFVVLIKTADLPAVQEFLREQKLHLRTEVAIDIDPITML
ncbi:MAG: primosomal protein N' [Selenomonas sp.]|nr:primosomal protein N' [Selenomonas sp.]